MLISAMIFAAFLILGFPIYIAILAGSLYIQIFVNHVTLEFVINGMFQTLGKTSILAVPLFILSGCLMARSSMGDRLLGGVLPWLRRLRGGIAISVVVANEIFGAMSGSAPAATATIGRVAYAPLVTVYGERFALGLIGSTGAIAIIMPPSIAMILYATATNTSTAKLFLGGIIPALILMVILGGYLMWVSPSNRGEDVFDKKTAIRETLAAIPVFILPVIILGGIYGGVFTPTEAAAVAAIYSFILPFVFFGELRWTELKASFLDCISLNSQLFIIVAASTVFSQALAMSNVARDLATALSGMNPFVFLIALNIFLLGVGCIFDPGPAILIIAPVVAPIAEKLGIDLIHLGIIITVNLAIGMFTPPYGLNLFVMQGIFKKSLEQVSAGIVPFFILFSLALLIVTFFPSLYMWLPGR